MPTSERTPAPFVFSTPIRSVIATGELTPVAEFEALARAQEAGTGVVGLIPFDPAREAHLYIPEHLEFGDSLTGTTAELAQPAELECLDNPAYRAAVGAAVARMNNGELDKVVLARLLHARYETPLNLSQVLANLLDQQPRAYVFSARLPESDNYLMGASPELVFRSEAGSFTTFPLAGTANRATAGDPTEDAQLGEELMRSAKDRAEHATVVEDIRERLAPVAEELLVPAVPQLVATPQLWHLGTEITGRLAPGMSSLDGARAIHPTPAICGSPRETALRLIDELEDFDRGFFGGLVGWMDPQGNGEWALVLRCAELSETSATLFAGAGIVKASQPEKEHAETGSKLGSFGRALGISTAS